MGLSLRDFYFKFAKLILRWFSFEVHVCEYFLVLFPEDGDGGDRKIGIESPILNEIAAFLFDLIVDGEICVHAAEVVSATPGADVSSEGFLELGDSDFW
jgi:hypothetical protein